MNQHWWHPQLIRVLSTTLCWLLDRAVALVGYKKEAAKLTKDALLRNLDIAEKLGCLNDIGLAEMRRGRAATVMKGPYRATSFPWITSSHGRSCPNWTT